MDSVGEISHTYQKKKKKKKGRITAVLWKMQLERGGGGELLKGWGQELTKGHKKMLMGNRVKSRYKILILK